MTKFKIVFIGTGDVGVPILEELQKDVHFTIPLVISSAVSSPLKNCAFKNNLFVHESNATDDLKQKIELARPDLLLVVDFGKIIPEAILKTARLAAVNIHPSLLPRYRGPSPIQEALLRGDRETGVTWIKMSEQMDAGEIIEQVKMTIEPADDYPALEKKLARLAADKTPEVLAKFSENPKSKKQDEALASYCRMVKRQDGRLNFATETAEQMLRKIKAYTPWPGTFLLWNGARLKVLKAEKVEQKNGSGEVHADTKNILIGTPKGSLRLRRVQLEGKKEMSVEEFLRGQRKIPSEIT